MTVIYPRTELSSFAGNIVPSTDDAYDLGSSSKEWQDIYIDGTATIDTLVLSTAAGEGVGSHIYPTATGTYNLGTSSYRWQYVKCVRLDISGFVVGNLLPLTDDTYDFGSGTYEWKDVYVDGTLYVDAISLGGNIIPETTVTYNLGSGTYMFNYTYTKYLQVYTGVDSHLIPKLDDNKDLGSATYEWKDLYLDGIARIDALHLDNQVSKTNTYTATTGDSVILVDTSSAFTITLPEASTCKGQVLIFIKTDANANALTIQGDGAQTIDGNNTYVAIDAQYDTITIISDGSNWFIISSKLA